MAKSATPKPKPDAQTAAIDHVVNEIKLLAHETNAERQAGGNFYNVAGELQGQVATLYKLLGIS